MTTDSGSKIESTINRDETTKFCRTTQVLIVMIATLLHGIFLSKAKPLQSANDRSRWCTVASLVQNGSFQIDEIRQRPGWDTIDLVHVNGHFYSTKPPLLTVLVAGITWCVQQFSGWNLNDQTQSVTFVVLLLTNLAPFVVSLIAWIAILDLCSDQPWTRLFALVIASFGTLVTPFLMTLNNHTVAAASTMVALFALFKILDESNSGKRWPYLLCGFATGWMAVNELPAASLGAILLGLAYRRSAWNTLIFLLPAAAIPVVALILTNVVATGSWKPTYADYGSDKYRFVIDGVPSYWMHPQGVDLNKDASRPWIYFLHCVVGHHGLFSLTPIALMALVGWMSSFRLRSRTLRTLLLGGAATSVIVIGFYMTRTQNYNYGGVSCGLRWAVWLTPLWLLAMVPALDAGAKSTLFRGMAILLASISIYSAWQPIDNPWRQPWLFQWMESREWIDYSDDRPELPRPLWTWFASLPKTSATEPAWIEFRVAQPGLSPRYVRLTARPDSTNDPETQVEIEIQETSADETTPKRIRTILMDTREFDLGAPPADVMRWSDPDVTGNQQQADLAFVRGLPRKVPYEARSIRYLKTPFRKDAFRCTLVTAHVAYAAHDNDPPLIYRCEAWLTDELPFGVAQVEFQISQPENHAVIFHERWIVHDCWPKPTNDSTNSR